MKKVIPKFKFADKGSKLLLAMANEHRLKMIELLAAHGELRVKDLREHLPIVQHNVSWHLAIMKRAKIVKARPKSQMTYYSLASKDCLKVMKAIKKIAAAVDGDTATD